MWLKTYLHTCKGAERGAGRGTQIIPLGCSSQRLPEDNGMWKWRTATTKPQPRPSQDISAPLPRHRAHVKHLLSHVSDYMGPLHRDVGFVMWRGAFRDCVGFITRHSGRCAGRQTSFPPCSPLSLVEHTNWACSKKHLKPQSRTNMSPAKQKMERQNFCSINFF